MAQKAKRARIKLTKHIIVEGKHVDKGKTIELDRGKAQEIVSAGQAKFVDEDDEEPDQAPGGEQYGVRIDTPTHGDPGPKVVEPRAPKTKNGGKSQAEA